MIIVWVEVVCEFHYLHYHPCYQSYMWVVPTIAAHISAKLSMIIILIISIKIILIGGLYRLLLHMSVLSSGPGSTTLLSVREEIKHIRVPFLLVCPKNVPDH